jgi:uncharacterized Zn-binding protein involved in type VI secretion
VISVGVNPPHTPVTAGSDGISAATTPNVCKMPGPPAPFVPTPLPNIGQSSDRPGDYTRTVKIEGKAIAIRGSYFMSKGDIASKGTGGGLISAATHGKTEFVAPGSMNVNAEGKNIQLLGDMMTNNGASPSNGGMTPKELQSPQSIADLCAAALAAAKRLAEKLKSLSKKERPNKVSVLITPNGRMVVGRNGGGVVNQRVTEAVDRAAKNDPQNKFGGRCAECSCVSRAMNKKIDVRASIIITVHVRGQNTESAKHGTKEPACSVCNPMLAEFGVIEC